MQRWLLTPPYTTWQADPGARIHRAALGSVVFEVLEDDDENVLLSGGLRISDVEPWIPRIVAADRRLIQAMYRHAPAIARRIPAHVTLVALDAMAPQPPPDTVHALLRARRLPVFPDVARWLAWRFDAPWILPRTFDLLARAWDLAPHPPPSTRAVRSACRRWLQCSYSDLCTVSALARLPRPQTRVKDLPELFGKSLDRLRERVRHLLGLRLSDYNARPGWEWVLEAAIRRRVIAPGAPDHRIRAGVRRLPSMQTDW